MRVMFVDDDADIRRVARIALSVVGGIDVTVVGSAGEAIELAQADPPTLILMDVMMPHLDGVAALAILRADPTLRHIPVVFLTARVQPREVADYLAQGAVGVIHKPFDPMTLADDVRRFLP
jgi:two-component system OmpR family response regulator